MSTSEHRSAPPAAVNSQLTRPSSDGTRSKECVAVTGTLSLTVKEPNPGALTQPDPQPRLSGKSAATTHRFAAGLDKLPPYLLRRVEKGVWWEPCVRYTAQKYVATPAWADPAKTAEVYREAERRREAGESVIVDHIVPLNSPVVCGLHWHGNLSIIGEKVNSLKSNHLWPDSWLEPHELDLPEEPHQLHLDL